MTATIPNEGGVVCWFAGENSISKFATEIVDLGEGLKGFSDTVTGINCEAVKAGADAAKSLAQMANEIPNTGGLVSWFTGDNSIASFADQFWILGDGLKDFSDSIEGVNADNITAAANAAKAIAEMAKITPKEGGMAAWFEGENSIASFAEHFPALGKGLKAFSDSVVGINIENVTAAANAAKTLAQIGDITATNSMSSIVRFGEKLYDFGVKLKEYFIVTSGISAEVVAVSDRAIASIKNAEAIDKDKIKKVAGAIGSLAKSISAISTIKSDSLDGFTIALKKVGEINVDALLETFKSKWPEIRTAGQDLLGQFLKGLDGNNVIILMTAISIVNKIVSAIKSFQPSFVSVGEDLGNGLVVGIQAKELAVYNAAYKLGQKAVQGEKDGQKSNSPSKLTIQAGNWFGEGLVIGIEQMGKAVYTSAHDLGETATGSISKSVSKIADIVNSDIDAQPTIRPVLDLSDVQAGASSISSLFSDNHTLTVGASGVGAISASMANRQNGNNELLSAINKLANSNNKSGDTYQINGINYSEGSDVADAIQTLVRAAKMEGRT
jgi:hypothetical protein